MIEVGATDRNPYMARAVRRAAMAAKEHTGLITGFRGGQHVIHPLVTIVVVDGEVDRDSLVGSKVVWRREDGFQLRGRVQGPHGNGRAVLVRWRKGLPPQGVGTRVTIQPK